MRKGTVVLVSALVFAILAAGFGARLYRKNVEQRIAATRAELAVAREGMRAAYRKRGATLRAWAGDAAKKDAEFNSLLVENDGLELSSQPEFDRFDFVQEQLNRKISGLMGAKKSAAKKPAEWEALERDVLRARSTFSAKAIEANRTGSLPEAVPVFKAEAELAKAPKK